MLSFFVLQLQGLSFHYRPSAAKAVKESPDKVFQTLFVQKFLSSLDLAHDYHAYADVTRFFGVSYLYNFQRFDEKCRQCACILRESCCNILLP